MDRLVVVDEVRDGGDDDRGEGVLGQKVEEGREEEEGKEEEEARDEPRELRLCAHCVVDGRAREGTRHRVGGGERAEQIGDAKGDKLLSGVDIVLVLGGEGLGDSDRLHEADDGASYGRRGDDRELAHVEQVRGHHLRNAFGDGADDQRIGRVRAPLEAAAVEKLEVAADDDSEDARDQRRRGAQPTEALLILHREAAREPQHEPPGESEQQLLPLRLWQPVDDVADGLVNVLRAAGRE